MSTVRPAEVAVYCRVSTDEQRERQTIENQVEAASAYCAARGLVIEHIYLDDGVSGTLALQDRPQGQRLLADASEGKLKTLLIKKIDRLGRDPLITLDAFRQLEALGVRVESISESIDGNTPDGRLMRVIYSAFAGFERDTILQRSREGTERLARQGAWLGGIVPYGYRVFGRNQDARLVPCDDFVEGLDMTEADVVRLMYRWAAHDGLSTFAIADRLNAMGVPACYARDGREVLRGKRKQATSGIWRNGRVRNLLTNPTYMGLHVWGRRSARRREVIRREVPAIVAAGVWEAAQATLKRNRRFSQKNAKHQYLLRGLMKCGKCGLTLSGTCRSRGDDRRYYICNGRKQRRGIYGAQGQACPSSTIPGEIEDQVWADVEGFLRDPGRTIEQVQAQLRAVAPEVEDLKVTESSLRSALDRKQGERDRVVMLYRQEKIDDLDLGHQLDQIAAEEAGLKDQLADVERHIAEQSQATAHLESAEAVLAQLRLRMDQPLDWDAKRHLVEMLVESIRVVYDSEEPEIEVRYRFGGAVTGKDTDSLPRSA